MKTFILILLLSIGVYAQDKYEPEGFQVVVISRTTALRIYSIGMDEAARSEVLAALDGSQAETDPVSIVISERIASKWRESLTTSPLFITKEMARHLSDAFDLALGVEPHSSDERWIVR